MGILSAHASEHISESCKGQGQRVKVLGAKPDNLSLTPGTYLHAGWREQTQVVL